MDLKARAIAAYEQAEERKRIEEAEREKQAKLAHAEELQQLCLKLLQLENAPTIQWVPATGYHWPVVDVDGLLFSSAPGKRELELLTFAGGSDCFQCSTDIHSIEHLGKILCDPYHKPARIEGNRLVPADEMMVHDAVKALEAEERRADGGLPRDGA